MDHPILNYPLKKRREVCIGITWRFLKTPGLVSKVYSFGNAAYVQCVVLTLILELKLKPQMPTISRFYGIVIYMNYRDHNPPYFHARYQNYEVTVDLDTGKVVGVMPKRMLKMIFEWHEKHATELNVNWERAKSARPLLQIEPLS